MLFLLSPDLTIKRKIFYIGLMIFVATLVLFTMVDRSHQDRTEMLNWIFPLSITGLSLVLLTLLSKNTHKKYKKFATFVLSIVIAPAITMFFYLATIFLNRENIGHEYILQNFALIAVINLILLSLVDIFLITKNEN